MIALHQFAAYVLLLMPRAASSMKSPPDYYAALGIAPTADRETIRRHYLRAMQRARKHPDLGGAHDEAALLNEAYMVLRDPMRRMAYDRLYLESRVLPRGIVRHATPAVDRRVLQRRPYRGMVLIAAEGTSVRLGGQCHDLSSDGCAVRTLYPLKTGKLLTVIFQDDPGLLLTGEVRWRRMVPQRFGPSLYEGGFAFHGVHADRFARFLSRIDGAAHY